MGINIKQVHGPRLIEAQYMIVPIKAGAKYPNKKGWPQIRSTMEDVHSWANSSYYGGFGVLGEFNPGIDIDVYDSEVVKKLVTWCMKNIGVSPVRTGNPPRVLIPYSAPVQKLGPDNSAKYEDELGNKNQIEIKAKGQQWVAYGIHPKTKKPYTWEGGELYSVDSEFLPTLTGSKIEALFNYLEEIAPPTWEKLDNGRTRKNSGGVEPDGQLVGLTAFENYRPPLNIDSDKIKSMLAHISPDSGHDIWRNVGMALYHQYAGSQEGMNIFVDWSQDSMDYDYDEILARWPTWSDKKYPGKPVTMATVVKMYNDAIKKNTDPALSLKSRNLSDWERRFVMVDLEESTEVHDAGVPIHKARRHTLKAFKEQNSAYLHRRMDPEGRVVTEPMVCAWQKSPNVRHFAGYTYQPGEPRFCGRPNSYGDDTQFVNTFYFPPHDEGVEDCEERILPFLNLLKHLFPEEAERAWMVQWLARLIQRPSVRSFVTPINITPVTGTGRGILFDILRLVVGGHNTHDVSPDDMSGRFNGFLDKCLVAVVQEIKANTGSKKYQMWERMKSLLADTVANIQEKGRNSYTANVYANFIMFSNNIDALPIHDACERRIYAMAGADLPLTNEEIDTLMSWKKDPVNIAALFKYLKNLKVDYSIFKRAPRSATKLQMVNACVDVTGADFSIWLEEEAPLVFDLNYASQELENFSEEMNTLGVSRKQLRRTLLDKGYHSAQVRINESRVYAYYHPGRIKPSTALIKRMLNVKREEEDILT